MFKFQYFLFFSLGFTSLAFAEPKKIVCSYDDTEYLSAKGMIAFDGEGEIHTYLLPINRQIELFKSFCGYSTSGEHCKRVEILSELAQEECHSSKGLPQYTFIIDTSDLSTDKDANADFSAETCGLAFGNKLTGYGKLKSEVFNVGFSATPSAISFSKVGSEKTIFNIDRKTLKAGYGTTRYLSCSIKDVDTSKNRI